MLSVQLMKLSQFVYNQKMGTLYSKSPLERRQTVLRRSQRKSVHGIRSKTEKLTKDINKFKGTDQDTAYIDLKARIEALDRELKSTSKNLQPQIRQIHADTLKKVQECFELLDAKLRANQEKAKEDVVKDDNDVVFTEDIAEEPEDKPKQVELNLVRVEAIETSPQFNKRASLIKIGVPVMPGTIQEALNRRTQDLERGTEEKIGEIRKKLEELEEEISKFVGRKNGRYYNKIKEQLGGFAKDLDDLPQIDEAIIEQVTMCRSYITSCLSFLDEKAIDDESSDSEDENLVDNSQINNLSPRGIRTTYI